MTGAVQRLKRDDGSSGGPLSWSSRSRVASVGTVVVEVRRSRDERIGLQTKRLVILSSLGAVAYFATAFWLRTAYHPVLPANAPKVSGEIVLLQRPFRGFTDSAFAAIANDTMFNKLADTADDTLRSDIELYEDEKPLGPAHSVHADVGKIGQGRFSHWRYAYSMFLFSSSDNTDPNTNGRSYWAVRPRAH